MAMAALSSASYPWLHLHQKEASSHNRRITSKIFASVQDESVSGIEQEAEQPQISDENEQQLQQAPEGSSRACKTCGRSEVMWGCDGAGKIQGGIGTVPGFTWWPIKAFRPCPAFAESGGRYKRQGQRLEEIAYGRKIDPMSPPSSAPRSAFNANLLPNWSPSSKNSAKSKKKRK